MHDSRGRTSLRRTILLTLSIVGLVLFALPVLAAPPGSFTFESTSNNGGVNDLLTFSGGPTNAEFEFNTDETNSNLTLNLHWEVFGGGYACDYTGDVGSGLNPELSFVDNGSSILVTVDASVFPSGHVELGCGDGIEYAEVEVFYDNEFFETQKFHTNSTGSQCRGVSHFNHNATARALITTADQGTMVDATGTSGSANYDHTEGRCHQTGTRGKP